MMPVEARQTDRRVCPAIVEHLASITPHRVALEVARGQLDFTEVLSEVGYRRLLVARHGTATHLVGSGGAALCRSTLRGLVVWSDCQPTCRACRRGSS